MDPKLADAVREAVEKAGQSSALARKLNAWLTEITTGNEDINNPAQADRHLEFIYEAVDLGEDEDAEHSEPQLAEGIDEEED